VSDISYKPFAFARTAAQHRIGCAWGKPAMDKFSLFFAFYSLILGLSITEILSGFGQFVRSHSLHKLGAQTALLALFIFLAITATWIDAFTALRAVELDVESLWAPILTSTAFYLAAVVVFPARSADFERLDDYYLEHKRLIIALLFSAEMLVTFTFLPFMVEGYVKGQPSFFFFYLPFHVVLKGSYVGAFFARTKRANVFWLSLLISLLLFNYWNNGAIPRILDRS
jgi:hypothetical protein